MNILLLETSSRNCSVAIASDEKLLCLCEEVSTGSQQSDRLHTFVQWALEGAEISIKEIHAVVLGQGPGSYTGLRIASSSAKGFAYGLGIPLYAVDSLQSMVQPYIHSGFDYIIPLIDARRMEVYTATYDASGGILHPLRPQILDEDTFADFQTQKTLFVGDGCTKLQSLYPDSQARFLPEVFPSAAYLIPAAIQAISKGEEQNLSYYEPLYLKEWFGQKPVKTPSSNG